MAAADCMGCSVACAGDVDADGSFTFEAAEGSALKVSLEGPGLDPASVTLTGPGGTVAAAVAGKPGSAKFAAVLDRGTGSFPVAVSASGPVSASFGVRLPKGPALTGP